MWGRWGFGFAAPERYICILLAHPLPGEDDVAPFVLHTRGGGGAGERGGEAGYAMKMHVAVHQHVSRHMCKYGMRVAAVLCPNGSVSARVCVGP